LSKQFKLLYVCNNDTIPKLDRWKQVNSWHLISKDLYKSDSKKYITLLLYNKTYHEYTHEVIELTLEKLNNNKYQLLLVMVYDYPPEDYLEESYYVNSDIE
jgi:hypothetical protein